MRRAHHRRGGEVPRRVLLRLRHHPRNAVLQQVPDGLLLSGRHGVVGSVPVPVLGVPLLPGGHRCHPAALSGRHQVRPERGVHRRVHRRQDHVLARAAAQERAHRRSVRDCVRRDAGGVVRRSREPAAAVAPGDRRGRGGETGRWRLSPETARVRVQRRRRRRERRRRAQRHRLIAARHAGARRSDRRDARRAHVRGGNVPSPRVAAGRRRRRRQRDGRQRHRRRRGV